jgi:hypothetical protein
MWDTVAGVAHVLCLATGNVEMYPQQYVLEAFGSVVHETELKALLIEKGFCQGPAQNVGR